MRLTVQVSDRPKYVSLIRVTSSQIASVRRNAFSRCVPMTLMVRSQSTSLEIRLEQRIKNRDLHRKRKMLYLGNWHADKMLDLLDWIIVVKNTAQVIEQRKE